ncbi:MAG: DUF1273 family protein [Firmicutes bacterium]|nr:DUF1273 family protein [Bacillota bacterium]
MCLLLNELEKRTGSKNIKICSFTGHRPEKGNFCEDEIKIELRRKINEAALLGYKYFISGMSRGFDILAAETVTEEGFGLICALPFLNFEESFGSFWKTRYKKVFQKNIYTVSFAPYYTGKSLYHIRNKWMVDNSSRIIAYCNGTKGGTLNTVNYAIKKGKEIVYMECTERGRYENGLF